jgi:hypothetical protein
VLPQRLDRCRTFYAAPTRDRFVYANERDLVVLDAAGERHLPLADLITRGACGKPEAIPRILYADATRVMLFQVTSNHYKNNAHYHAEVEVACLVDLATGAASQALREAPLVSPLLAALGDPHSLEARAYVNRVGAKVTLMSRPARAFVWSTPDEGFVMEAIDLDTRRAVFMKTPMPRPACALRADEGRLTVACMQGDVLRGAERRALDLVTFDVANWPPQKVSQTTLPVEPFNGYANVTLSPDGQLLAYWGRGWDRAESWSSLGVIDLSSGAEVFSTRWPAPGEVDGVEFDPAGHGLFVSEYIGSGPGLLRYLGVDGVERARWAVPFAAKQVFLASSRDRLLLASTCEAAMVGIAPP